MLPVWELQMSPLKGHMEGAGRSLMVSLVGAEGWANEDRHLAWESVNPGRDLTFRSRGRGMVCCVLWGVCVWV